MLVVFVMLAWKTRRWLLELVGKAQGCGPRPDKEDHEVARGIMTRLWLTHSTFIDCLDMSAMFGSWLCMVCGILGNSLSFVLTVCGLWFQVLPVRKGRARLDRSAYTRVFPQFVILRFYSDNCFTLEYF